MVRSARRHPLADPALLEELHPQKLLPSPDEVPDRFELGTLPFESLAGVAGRRGLRASSSTGTRSAPTRTRLLTRMLDGLGALDGVTLYGAARDRTPTLMFNVAGHTSPEVATAPRRARDRGLARQLLRLELERHLGLEPDGAVRAGFVHYNDEADADRLVAAVAELSG